MTLRLEQSQKLYNVKWAQRIVRESRGDENYEWRAGTGIIFDNRFEHGIALIRRGLEKELHETDS